ncbi:hypothetical protein ACF058_14245 [Streptomyces sp. NPDC015501]|uniref:hypothetical protein n=1 Tax=unclassified Streptomyces TaxID=2593676 RepID=UPI0011A7517E|nr:hypothetical protein A3L22_17430 [Streptomyces griseus subsp. griseus]
MSERRDPLRSLFREAGEFGQVRADPDDASRIAQRGMRARRRRMAAVAVGVCLVVGGGGATAVGMLPVRPEAVAPATDPSPGHPPPVPPHLRLSTDPPSPPSPATTLPGGTGGTGGTGAEDPSGRPTRTSTGMSATGTPRTPPTATAPTTAPATRAASATASATTDGTESAKDGAESMP